MSFQSFDTEVWYMVDLGYHWVNIVKTGVKVKNKKIKINFSS